MRDEVKGKKILVVGMGKSGKAAVQELHKLGAQVVAQDVHTVDAVDPKFAKYLEKEGIPALFGCNPDNMGEYDLVVISPGVSPDLSFLQEARLSGVEVIGELELAYRLSKGTFIAITGTNGKTTTTTLVGKIFEKARRKTAVVGNIGVAVVSKALESTEDEWMVTEASSFQLETVKKFHAKVSAILNLTPDHLNRHKTMEAYGAAKAQVFRNQDENDYLVINYDDKTCFALAEKCKATVVPFSRKEELKMGAFLQDDEMVIRDENGIVRPICSIHDLKIIGAHNVENALAAAAISFFAGVDPESIREAIVEFPGVEHRIEYCGLVDGVKFYNDSKGTNVDAAVIALKALKENIVLIAGGDGKAQDFTELAENLQGRVKALVLLGRDANQIEACARKVGFDAIYNEKDMNACVKKCMELAEEGDKVLLSPACASWDMYDNYEQRGDHFKACVQQLLR